MTEFKYNRFISASIGTREQLVVMGALTQGHWISYQTVQTSHDYQVLWNETAQEALSDMGLYFDTETMLPFRIYRCMKVLCGTYAHNLPALANIKKLLTTGMYGIDGQGHISQLSLDLINEQLIPKYFKKSNGMTCESLL